MKIKQIAIVIISALMMQGCFDNPWGSCIRGDRSSVVVYGIVEPFNGIESGIHGDIIVNITDTPTDEIIIRGEGNIISVLNTEVINGTLHIDYSQCVRRDDALQITLNTNRLEYIELNGAGDLTIVGENSTPTMHVQLDGAGDITFNALTEDLNVWINGSGDLFGSGSTTHEDIRIGGSGDYHGKNLQALNCDVTISGSGDIYVTAMETLDVIIPGSGSVFYAGNPLITKTITGSGTVTQVN